jgi:hypothetical protein
MHYLILPQHARPDFLAVYVRDSAIREALDDILGPE